MNDSLQRTSKLYQYYWQGVKSGLLGCTKCTLPKNAKVLQTTTHHKETVLRSTPHSTLFSKNRIFDCTIPTLKQFFFPFINIEFIPFFHCCRLDLRALVTSSIRMCITKPAWWCVYRFQICSSFWLNHFKHYDVISVFIVGTWLYIVADIFVKQLIILDWEIGATIGFVWFICIPHDNICDFIILYCIQWKLVAGHNKMFITRELGALRVIYLHLSWYYVCLYNFIMLVVRVGCWTYQNVCYKGIRYLVHVFMKKV